VTRTLVISDLHLGGLSGVDLLRRPALRERLLERLADIDRLVLLGDVLELRHGPPHETLAAARPFFEDVGQALGGDREVVITAGNHDHLTVCGWLDARALRFPEPPPLGLEQRIDPAEASPLLGEIERWCAPARVSVAYPGVWLRPDVYAMHGHYLDAHLTIPTLERIGVGAMGRLLERRPADPTFGTVEDYEAVTAPIYAWRDAMTRYTSAGPTLNGLATARAWRALGGGGGGDGGGDGGTGRDAHAGVDGRAGADGRAGVDGDGRPGAGGNGGAGADGRAGAGGHAGAHSAGRRGGLLAGGRRLADAALESARDSAIKNAFAVAVAGLNRAGLGPLKVDISRTELRRAGLLAIGEVAARLGLGDAYVIFGHTHRAGPLPGDDLGEWRGREGARLLNCGSWVYEPVFVARSPGESPYWPGACAVVEDTGPLTPPVVERLLADCTPAELAARPARQPARPARR
jgi:Calcineurin-like phosphoesterase